MLTENSLFAMTKIVFTDSPIIFVHDYLDNSPEAMFVEYLNDNLKVSDLEGFEIDDFLEYGSSEMIIPALDEYINSHDLRNKFDIEPDQELIPLHLMDISGSGYVISVAFTEIDEDAEDGDIVSHDDSEWE